MANVEISVDRRTPEPSESSKAFTNMLRKSAEGAIQEHDPLTYVSRTGEEIRARGEYAVKNENAKERRASERYKSFIARFDGQFIDSDEDEGGITTAEYKVDVNFYEGSKDMIVGHAEYYSVAPLVAELGDDDQVGYSMSPVPLDKDRFSVPDGYEIVDEAAFEKTYYVSLDDGAYVATPEIEVQRLEVTDVGENPNEVVKKLDPSAKVKRSIIRTVRHIASDGKVFATTHDEVTFTGVKRGNDNVIWSDASKIMSGVSTSKFDGYSIVQTIPDRVVEPSDKDYSIDVHYISRYRDHREVFEIPAVYIDENDDVHDLPMIKYNSIIAEDVEGEDMRVVVSKEDSLESEIQKIYNSLLSEKYDLVDYEIDSDLVTLNVKSHEIYTAPTIVSVYGDEYASAWRISRGLHLPERELSKFAIGSRMLQIEIVEMINDIRDEMGIDSISGIEMNLQTTASLFEHAGDLFNRGGSTFYSSALRQIENDQCVKFRREIAMKPTRMNMPIEFSHTHIVNSFRGNILGKTGDALTREPALDSSLDYVAAALFVDSIRPFGGQYQISFLSTLLFFESPDAVKNQMWLGGMASNDG